MPLTVTTASNAVAPKRPFSVVVVVGWGRQRRLTPPCPLLRLPLQPPLAVGLTALLAFGPLLEAPPVGLLIEVRRAQVAEVEGTSAPPCARARHGDRRQSKF